MKLYDIYIRKNETSNWQLTKVTSSFIIKELVVKKLRKKGYFVEVDYKKDKTLQYISSYYPILK